MFVDLVYETPEAGRGAGDSVLGDMVVVDHHRTRYLIPLSKERTFLPLDLHEGERIFLVAGLGGESGSLLATMAARQAVQRSCRVDVIGVTPFAFEGKETQLRASTTAKALTALSASYYGISNEMAAQSLPDHSSLQDAFAAIDTQVLRAATQILRPEFPSHNDFSRRVLC